MVKNQDVDENHQSDPGTQVQGGSTKSRIVQAAWETIRNEGIIGVSARSIARTGGFNQALIFYHYGSVHELLIAVMKVESQRRSAIYEKELENVTTLRELVQVGQRLHQQEVESGAVTVLTQLCSSAGGKENLREAMSEAMGSWHEVITGVIDRLLGKSALMSMISSSDLAWTVGALFMGIELFTSIDVRFESENNLFSSIEQFVGLLEQFV